MLNIDDVMIRSVAMTERCVSGQFNTSCNAARSLVVLSLLLAAGCRPRAADSVRILFVGDIMAHDAQIASALKAGGTYDFSSVFTYVAPIIGAADIAVGNLEVTLPGNPPYTGYPFFRSPDALAASLQEAGFDMFMAANNHAGDSGFEGVLRTLECLDRLGIAHAGTYASYNARQKQSPLIIERNGFRFAFLNYTYGLNVTTGLQDSVVNVIDEEAMATDLASEQCRTADAVVVYLHWGSEYTTRPDPDQEQLAANLVKMGADAVIGSHPHVVQTIKRLEIATVDGGARTGLVAYSLGNFVSNQSLPGTDSGLMLEVEWSRSHKFDKPSISRVVARPTWCRKIRQHDGKTSYAVIPVREALTGSVSGLNLSDQERDELSKLSAPDVR